MPLNRTEFTRLWEKRWGRLTPADRRRLWETPEYAKLLQLPTKAVKPAVNHHRNLSEILDDAIARTREIAPVLAPISDKPIAGTPATRLPAPAPCGACGLVPDPLSGKCQC